ncbi:oxygen-independent coproporphyrinogen-3 oxidase [Mesorhizobium soli]|uniref:oxygen-independent coproporphyrinogen III oxidase n=1 Tax=Pseudaminobacter soli (ex Li et al. 2025) TaxID=1295366 RepID=UPI0024762FCD|nr:oxygen-independent coproporphyrinogen III oxidase [Mesorhizobium soli]MDH6230819.1 oxygen-independent coproporphyrinogen-3 oxidase [Mesorhizobium soli]
MQPDLIRKHAAPVPRYTSYPTAPHFHAGINAGTYREWLGAIAPGTALSLYAHIPFCDRLCWFCACNTKQTRRYQPLADYLTYLYREIATVAGAVDGRVEVGALHFGGGSPTMLAPDDMRALNDVLRSAFKFRPDAEISVEIDPNDMDEARFDALAEIGMTRVSLGVQDFDPRVQQAINREQTFDQTRAVVDGARMRGVSSVNIDLLYGLPHQTRESVEATVEQALLLNPDRIALFGYAHVPWMRKHQTMIDEAALPDALERFSQSSRAAEILLSCGYQAIGIDHFARPDETMAIAHREGRLRRNFQGYTVDDLDTLIGLGASAIGKLPQGYVQNNTATSEYQRLVSETGLGVTKGFALSEEDRMRAWVIERLMCDFSFSKSEFARCFGAQGTPVIEIAEKLLQEDEDGLIASSGDRFVVTSRGRPVVRSVVAAFDAYFGTNGARHSIAV